MSGTELAARTGISQAKISRIETGRSRVSAADVRVVAEVLHLDSSETDRLVALAGLSRPGARMAEWRHDPAEIERKQIEIGEVELNSNEIRVFQPTIVPGLLQTSGYAEAIMRTPLRLGGLAGADDSEAALLAAVGGRIQRQHVLKVDGKKFFFVITEWVLANRLVDPAEMLAQIHRIRQIARQANVSIRIIPSGTTLSLAPMNGFQLFDDKLLMIDLYNTSLTSQLVVDVKAHQLVFESMTEASVTGIDEILSRYTELYKGLLGD